MQRCGCCYSYCHHLHHWCPRLLVSAPRSLLPVAAVRACRISCREQRGSTRGTRQQSRAEQRTTTSLTATNTTQQCRQPHSERRAAQCWLSWSSSDAPLTGTSSRLLGQQPVHQLHTAQPAAHEEVSGAGRERGRDRQCSPHHFALLEALSCGSVARVGSSGRALSIGGMCALLCGDRLSPLRRCRLRIAHSQQ